MHDKKYVYLDHAAATPLDPRVAAAMEPYGSMTYANAGALHAMGVAARSAVADARRTVASAAGVQAEEVVFTSGGTESNNLALVGVVRRRIREGSKPQDIHIITSAIEHASILDCARALEETGVSVTVLPVDTEGRVRVGDLLSALRPETVLVSVMLASNEIGTIQPIGELARALAKVRKERSGIYPLLHTDASQAPAWLSCNAHALGVDLMTLDGQKLGGPKGIGALVRLKHVPLEPVLYGGNQEFGLRPGTPPTQLIIGFAEALRLAQDERASYVSTIRELRDNFMSAVEQVFPDAELHGARGDGRMPNNINFSIPGIDGERIVLGLDVRGVAASTRSACMLGEAPGSVVVRALGKGDDAARGAVRFTLGRATTASDVEYALAAYLDVVRALRAERTPDTPAR